VPNTKLILLLIAPYLLSACVTKQQPDSKMVWVKPGTSQTEFAQDRYACMKESQQRVSTTIVNEAVGSSLSNVVTNGQLFGACMNAKGWVLQNEQTATGPFPQAQAYPCTVGANTPCNASDFRAKHD
jgi:hypothetical protein